MFFYVADTLSYAHQVLPARGNDMDIKALCVAHGIDLSQCGVSLGGGGFTLFNLKTSPVEFLSLAEDDYQRGGLSALVNATTNAKRAIVSQMDQLLISFGYDSFRWNVPRKVEKLRALGLLAPSLLRKAVTLRNLLEHEYETPSLSEVEEALDVASLFVLSATGMFIPFDDVLEFSLYGTSDAGIPIKQVTVGLDRDPERVYYTAYAYECGDDGNVCVGQCEIPSGHALFDPMVKLSASMMLKYRVDQACKDFDAAFSAL